MRNSLKKSLALISLLSFLMAVPLYASEVSEAVMGNGLRVLVDADPSAQLVAIDVWVKAGSINETPENNGVSHFIEHMLFKGTKKHPQGQADLEIESLGATLDAFTSEDWAHFRTTVASRYYKTALDVLSDAICNAAFKSEHIEKEKAIILDEIARRDMDPLNLVDGLFNRTAYKEHPYGLEVEGTAESVRKLNRDTILDYYNTYYVPNNMTVVIVGDVDRVDAVSSVGSCFSGLTKKDIPNRQVKSEPASTEVRRAVLEKSFGQTHMMIGFHGPAVSDLSDVYATDVLLSYLGVGYRSWLSIELKDKQKLIVEGTADFLTHRDPGTISVYTAVDPANVGKAERVILDKIKELRTTPIPEFDLARAKRSLEGNYAFEGETYAGRANSLGFYDALSNYKIATEYIAGIRKVTADDIKKVAEKYMDPEKAIIATVGAKGSAQ